MIPVHGNAAYALQVSIESRAANLSQLSFGLRWCVRQCWSQGESEAGHDPPGADAEGGVVVLEAKRLLWGNTESRNEAGGCASPAARADFLSIAGSL